MRAEPRFLAPVSCRHCPKGQILLEPYAEQTGPDSQGFEGFEARCFQCGRSYGHYAQLTAAQLVGTFGVHPASVKRASGRMLFLWDDGRRTG